MKIFLSYNIEKRNGEIIMKKKSTVLFITTFVFGILACSLVMFLLFNISMKENEGSVKEIKVSANAKELAYAELKGSVETYNLSDGKNTKKSQETLEQNQSDILKDQGNTDNNENLTNEKEDTTLISGSIDKSIPLDASTKNITIDSAIDEVLIYVSETKELEITQIYENLYTEDLFKIREETEKIVIETTSTGDKLQLPSNKSFTRKSTLEVRLPKNFTGTLDVSCDVGSILVKDGLNLEELNLSSDIGDITIQKAHSIKRANVQCDIGNVTVKEAWNVDVSTFRVEVGNVRFDNTIKANDLTVDVEIGNILAPSDVLNNKKFSLKVDIGVIKGY